MPRKQNIVHLFSPETEELHKTYNVLQRLLPSDKPARKEAMELLLKDPPTWTILQARQILYPLSAIYKRFTRQLTYDQQDAIAYHYPAIADTEVDLEEYCIWLTDLPNLQPGDYISRDFFLEMITDVADHIDILEDMVVRGKPCPVDQRTDDPLAVDWDADDEDED